MAKEDDKYSFDSKITDMGVKKVINVPAKVRDEFPTGTKVTVTAIQNLADVNRAIKAAKKEGDAAIKELKKAGGD